MVEPEGEGQGGGTYGQWKKDLRGDVAIGRNGQRQPPIADRHGVVRQRRTRQHNRRVQVSILVVVYNQA